MFLLDSASGGWLLTLAPLALVVVLCQPSAEPVSVSRRLRLALVALCTPLFCPTRGVASAFCTGLAVVIATRLPDLPNRASTESPLSRTLWLTGPVVQSLPDDPLLRRQQRKAAPRFLLRAALKRLAWEPIGLWMNSLDPHEVPLVGRTAFLVLYFVLNLTALADLLLFVAGLLGARTEEVFDWPLLSTSPREFWSRRWNRYVARFALRHVAMPLRARYTGPLPGVILTLTVFSASALFHEYFAWGASGAASHPPAMTVFFLLQGLVVAIGQLWNPLSWAPRALKNLLTAAWMLLTAPIFFSALEPAVIEFGFPAALLPGVWPWLPWLHTR